MTSLIRYIAFFALTGMNLALEVLLPHLPAAALMFALRLAGISIGAYWGGRLGGAAPDHYERYWMAFVTQASAAGSTPEYT
jgi:Kef-type K+ transport system membrane component KefB